MPQTYQEFFDEKVKEHSKIKQLLTKKERTKCYVKRDAYMNCSIDFQKMCDQNNSPKEIASLLKKCESQMVDMFTACPSSWVDHFMRGDMMKNYDFL